MLVSDARSDAAWGACMLEHRSIIPPRCPLPRTWSRRHLHQIRVQPVPGPTCVHYGAAVVGTSNFDFNTRSVLSFHCASTLPPKLTPVPLSIISV